MNTFKYADNFLSSLLFHRMTRDLDARHFGIWMKTVDTDFTRDELIAVIGHIHAMVPWTVNVLRLDDFVEADHALIRFGCLRAGLREVLALLAECTSTVELEQSFTPESSGSIRAAEIRIAVCIDDLSKVVRLLIALPVVYSVQVSGYVRSTSDGSSGVLSSWLDACDITADSVVDGFIGLGGFTAVRALAPPRSLNLDQALPALGTVGVEELISRTVAIGSVLINDMNN